MKKYFSLFILNKYTIRVVGVFFALSLLSIFITSLPFQWWYGVVVLLVHFAFVCFVLYQAAIDDTLLDQIKHLFSEKELKSFEELKQKAKELEENDKH